MPLKEFSSINIENKSPFEITCTVGKRFHLTFSADRGPPEIRSELPDRVHMQGFESEKQRVHPRKFNEVQCQSGSYIVANGYLFIFQSGQSDGQVASQEGHVGPFRGMELAPQKQPSEDPKFIPKTDPVGAVAAQSEHQWSDTEPDTDLGVDSAKGIHGNAET
ncbi:hypothetical protein LTS12_028314, partial [Elasticomyces elasticus]